MFGEKLFPQVGYPTPTAIPDETSCLTLEIPASDEWWAIVVGVLYTLILEWNWQQFEGGLDRDVVAARWQIMLENALDVAGATNSCPTNTIDAPFWDDAEDIDDELPITEQPWYGTVSDPEAPPEELDFVENAAIFALTGFLAVATWEIGAAPAILFHTIAPKFVLAMKRGDVGEIIRILVDGEEAARVDTTSYAEGDLIDVPIIADPAITTGHDIVIVQVS